jgi:pimeloyl-ACP methyl ester carboxylesterase
VDAVSTIATHEQQDVDKVNATGRTPAVFVHGLWLLPSSWDRWAEVFDEAGYVALAPGWPDDPETVAEANANPDTLANKTVGDVADHFAEVIGKLDRKPVVIGHSFGGLLAQILAGRGLSTATVAIDPAPFRGVLPLPVSALRSASPVLTNPANRHRAVPLTYEQFRYAFANAVDEDEARQLYDAFAVPAPGAPLFQAATANFNPWTEVKVDNKNPERGPLLIISGEKDHTVPWAIANASFKKQKKNKGAITEIVEISGRGHALTIDSGWREVADKALEFVRRFT